MRSVWFAAVLALVSTGVAQGQSDGDLRLVGAFGNTTVSAGRVEFYFSGEWGTVCVDGFGQTEADVVCRQLGFGVAISYGNNLGFDSGSSFQRMWLDQVDCNSNDTNVFRDCTYNITGVEDCSHSKDIMVVCSDSTQTNTHGNLRLVQNGTTSRSFEAGRLEIFINGQWGTICDNFFGNTEADVACHQLGYSSASQHGNDLSFGFGSSSQPIWLDTVNCHYLDTRIIDCSHNSFGSHNCSHFEDVMVECGTISNVIGIILGKMIGGIVSIMFGFCVLGITVACVFWCVCAARSSTRSRRTAAAPVVTGDSAGAATVTKPVQDCGNEAKKNPQTQLSSQQPSPAYDAAQQYPPSQQQQPYPQDQGYPPPTQAPYPTDQQAAAVAAAPNPGAGDPAYPPAAGQGSPQQN